MAEKPITRPVPTDGPLSGPVLEGIRRAVGTGQSIRQIAAAAGVAPQQVSRFVQGKRTPDLRTLDRLLPVLGLAVTAEKKSRKSRVPS